MLRLQADSVNARLWAHDPTLWTDDPAAQAEIKIRLGWLNLPETSRNLAREATAFAREIKAAGINKTLLLGMGGSSLAPEVMSLTFNIPHSSFSILDSTDPAQVADSAKNFPPKETLYIVASKSGGTAETMAALAYFWEKSGGEGSHFIAITDEGSNLEKIAVARNFRKIFRADPNVGGRYSALTAFGLVPAALLGINLNRALDSAAEMMAKCTASERSAAQTKGDLTEENPALYLGAWMGEAALQGRDKLTLITDAPFSSFGAWAEQLIAESSGKEGKGIVPIEGEDPLDAAQYGDDRLFVYLRQKGEHDEFVKALKEQNQPVYEIPLTDRYALFTEFYRWEYATAIACHILGVNAFDQPNVEAAKIQARAQISAYSRAGVLDEGVPVWEGENAKLYANVPITGASLKVAFDSFLALARKNDYLSIQAYLPRNRETSASLQKFRHRLQEKTGLATTLGFAPRFLHSTGQLHKGGANNGLFIQITADPPFDFEIPSQGLSFGTLERAQALGDYAALDSAGRRVLRLHLAERDWEKLWV
jgi:transaldolase/glucose-6-phosphate isomerase